MQKESTMEISIRNLQKASLGIINRENLLNEVAEKNYK